MRSAIAHRTCSNCWARVYTRNYCSYAFGHRFWDFPSTMAAFERIYAQLETWVSRKHSQQSLILSWFVRNALISSHLGHRGLITTVNKRTEWGFVVEPATE